MSATGSPNDRTVGLAFSKDGRTLREIKEDPYEAGRVRAITYVASTGAISHLWTLPDQTRFYSATTDLGEAIIFVGTPPPDEHGHVVLFDTQTGKTQDIPPDWFDKDDRRPFATISGDGRLVAALSWSGPSGTPMVVSVYDWRTKKLVAKQMSGEGAGISGGGVTAEGKIEFSNNRSGSEIVDPETGRLIISLGPTSRLSLDGAWVVEFPDPTHEESPREVFIRNAATGKTVGKLDLQISDEEELGYLTYSSHSFCGNSGRFIATTNSTVRVFEIPSGKRIANISPKTWKDKNVDLPVVFACSQNGKRVAIRSGIRLTLHNLK